jgi:hypothetical protein
MDQEARWFIYHEDVVVFVQEIERDRLWFDPRGLGRRKGHDHPLSSADTIAGLSRVVTDPDPLLMNEVLDCCPGESARSDQELVQTTTGLSQGNLIHPDLCHRSPFPPVREDFDNHEGHPHRNGGICDIKGRPVVRPVVKIQKVHHHTETEPIYEISHGPAEDEGKAQERKQAHPWVPEPVIDDEESGEESDRGKKG